MMRTFIHTQFHSKMRGNIFELGLDGWGVSSDKSVGRHREQDEHRPGGLARPMMQFVVTSV